MKKEFLENVFNILSKNLNVEEILSKSKETSIRNFKKNLISFSENKLTKAEMEKVISSFLEKYVNDIEIFKYNLFRYKSFFFELDDFLLGECYEI